MIRFGTSGWRALIGDSFTFRNVRLVTQAIANLLETEPGVPKRVVVGYDTRFLSEKVAKETAKVLSSCRVEAIRMERDAPTPALSHTIIKREAQGGIYFTASHNPPEYNGLKYYVASGAPAPDAATRALEQEIDRLERAAVRTPILGNERYRRTVDSRGAYLKHLLGSVNLDRVRRAGIKLVVDPLYGTARDYLDRVLIEHECPTEVIHNFTDPYFGGYSPACSEVNLADLRAAVGRTDADLGLATDGDGDRFGVLDGDGKFFSADQLLPVLLDYLIRDRELSGAVARTVSTTHMIDAVCAAYGLKVLETPVGFKYFGDRLHAGDVVFGCEESAGLALADHLPEKDGILACLLVAEMVATTGKSLSELRAELEREHGRFVQRKADMPLTTGARRRLSSLSRRPPERLADQKVVSTVRSDGTKLVLKDGSWCLLRKSGTEPLVRVYVEAGTLKRAERLLATAQALVTGEAAKTTAKRARPQARRPRTKKTARRKGK
jgi:phosphoglucomutase